MNNVNEIRENLHRMLDTLMRIEDADDHARIHDAFNESSRLVSEANHVRVLCEKLHTLYINELYETNKNKPKVSDGSAYIFWGEDRN